MSQRKAMREYRQQIKEIKSNNGSIIGRRSISVSPKKSQTMDNSINYENPILAKFKEVITLQINKEAKNYPDEVDYKMNNYN